MFRLLKNGISALNVSIFLDFDNPTIIIILQPCKTTKVFVSF